MVNIPNLKWSISQSLIGQYPKAGSGMSISQLWNGQNPSYGMVTIPTLEWLKSQLCNGQYPNCGMVNFPTLEKSISQSWNGQYCNSGMVNIQKLEWSISQSGQNGEAKKKKQVKCASFEYYNKSALPIPVHKSRPRMSGLVTAASE